MSARVPAAGRLAARARRLIGREPVEPPTLEVVDPRFALAQAASLEALMAPQAGSGWLELAPTGQIPGEALMARMAGHVGGEDPPEWTQATEGALTYGTSLMRVRQAVHMPGYGAVVDAEGRIFIDTVDEARFITPDMTGLPGVRVDAEGRRTLHPGPCSALPRATVFMAWGGLHNYGHMLIDCLSALAAVADAGLLERYPPIAPPLNGWRSELLALFLGPDVRTTVIRRPWVRLDDVLFANPMGHFLHAPNALLASVRRRLLAHLGPSDRAGPKRVYLSRRSDTKRVMSNEAALEVELARRGYRIVQPETLAVAEQAKLLRDAEVVVAATGAALAGAMFMAPGAKVVEIQPSNFTGIWVRQLCLQLDLDWHAFFCRSPSSEPGAEASLQADDAHPEGYAFTYALPTADFLDYLDART